MSDASPLLVLVGTYGEKLGHVDGKGEGVYALLLDRATLAPHVSAATSPYHAKPQLGEAAGGARNPSWVTAYRDGADGPLCAYVADEVDESTLLAARVDEATGQLTQLGQPVLTGGGIACHISVAPGGAHVLVAMYCGAVCAVERHADGSLGARVALVELPPPEWADAIGAFPRANAARQEASHPHMVLESRSAGKHAFLVPDLGGDVIWALEYSATASPPLLAAAPTAIHPRRALDGAGPRHVALHPTLDVGYVAYELSSQVAAFALDRATGRLGDTPLPPGPVCTLGAAESSAPFAQPFDPSLHAHLLSAPASDPTAVKGLSERTSVAAIRVAADGAHVYVSNRLVGTDGAISAIPLRPDGALAPPAVLASSRGRTPRDFVLLAPHPSPAHAAPSRILVANQDSDTLWSLPLGHGTSVHVADVPTPVCLCLAP